MLFVESRYLEALNRGFTHRQVARLLAEPGGLLGKLYSFYFKKVLPRIGTLISGVRGPYNYLPASVSSFPSPDEMLGRMRSAHYRNATWRPYTFGIAGLYRAAK